VRQNPLETFQNDGKKQKAYGNAASVKIHKKRGFSQAAWKSLTQKQARLFHIPTGPTRFSKTLLNN
jgi:hypothetical protein